MMEWSRRRHGVTTTTRHIIYFFHSLPPNFRHSRAAPATAATHASRSAAVAAANETGSRPLENSRSKPHGGVGTTDAPSNDIAWPDDVSSSAGPRGVDARR